MGGHLEASSRECNAVFLSCEHLLECTLEIGGCHIVGEMDISNNWGSCVECSSTKVCTSCHGSSKLPVTRLPCKVSVHGVISPPCVVSDSRYLEVTILCRVEVHVGDLVHSPFHVKIQLPLSTIQFNTAEKGLCSRSNLPTL